MILAIIAAMIAVTTAAQPVSYEARVDHVIDGDTVAVRITDWPAPFTPISVRILGIDTPEHVKPPAQAACEVVLGKQAIVAAKTLLHPADKIVVTWDGKHRDKYGRLLATVRLASGVDYGAEMIARHVARAYDGGHKDKWC